ncbi:TY1 enhancer activator [Cytospora mali]|uniref:TY1 enhancer activator n=1 Tax=Cytospora mali TaxID=578113 RepID=A0A194W2I5_CYTMA|nr:TY1 enhancer activator [Valsa mali]
MALSLLPRGQESSMPDVSVSRATQACTKCKKQKRKCDKILPACSRCVSLQRTCDYSEATGTSTPPTAEAFAILQMKLAEIEAKMEAASAAISYTPQAGADGTPGSSTFVGGTESSPEDVAMGNSNSKGDMWTDSHAEKPVVRNRFPPVFFLDSDVYKGAGVRIPKANIDIPMSLTAAEPVKADSVPMEIYELNAVYLWLLDLDGLLNYLTLTVTLYRFRRPCTNKSQDVLEILASTNVIEDAASTYFETIHRWFPFISRKRMNLGLSLHAGGPDLALLFLTMKLITTPPSPDMAPSSATDSHLYTTSKRFLALLESAGTVSILYLQAMILITLYEFGHGIYPAAWMSSGSAVRYASMLGLPSYQEACLVLGQCTTWTEAEERKRVWWATHILDRAISLGTRKPFAGGPDTPPDTEFLPVSDRAWDEGDVTGSLQRAVGTAVDERLGFGPFARLAQASVLITRAMAHCKRATTRYVRSRSQKADGKNGVEDEKPFDIKEATDMMVEVKGLCAAITDDLDGAGGMGSDAYFALAPSRCLVWSTSVLVLDLYACPEHMRPGAGTSADETRTEEELAMQVEAISGLIVASEKVRVFAGELLTLASAASPGTGGRGVDGAGEGMGKFSPLCFDSLYSALATFHWQWQESGQPEMKQGMDEMKAALVRIAPRWRLAGEYLEVDRHHDVASMMSTGPNET